jgi:hypothetical protein
MMYSIGGNGLQAIKKIDLTIGCTYYMGASDSPDVVHILDVGPSRITYARTYKGVVRSDDRRIVEDLIATGCATILARGRMLDANSPAYAIEGQKIYEARIGASRPSSDFDHHTVRVTTTHGSCDTQDNWYAAEEYGGVAGIDDMLEIECSGKALVELRNDSRFAIVSEVRTHSAPLTRDEENAIERSAEDERVHRSA